MRRLQISSHVDFTSIDGQAVLLDAKRGRYLSVDEVGTRIWELLIAGDGEVDQVFAPLLDEFDVDEERLRQDLEVFVRRCLDLGLLTERDR